MTIIIIIIIIIQQVFVKALAQKHKCKVQKYIKRNTYGTASPTAAATATAKTRTTTTNKTKINQVPSQQPLSVHQTTLLLMHVLTQQPQFK